MVYSYGDNNIEHIISNIKVGSNWDELKIKDDYINSIFNNIDNGDRIVSQQELNIINEIYDFSILQEKLPQMFSPQNNGYQKFLHSFNSINNSPTKILEKINSDNLSMTYEEYKRTTGSSLINDVLNSDKLSKEEKTQFLYQIKDVIIDYAKRHHLYTQDISEMLETECAGYEELGVLQRNNYFDQIMEKAFSRWSQISSGQSNNVNGKIDNDYKQGRTGDCWLIATIIALSKHPKGKEVLNNCVTPNEDGSMTVYLKGVDKKYHISAEELSGRNELATGDLDVRAIEIAIDKYFYEQRGVNGRLDINGNNPLVALDIINGKGDYESQRDYFPPFYLDRNNNMPYTGPTLFSPPLAFGLSDTKSIDPKKQLQEYYLKEINNTERIHTVSAFNKEAYSFKNNTEEDVTLISNHAYVIERADEKNVYIINPWDSSKTIAIPIEEFFNFFDQGINTMKVL